jgi:hypothetical protein
MALYVFSVIGKVFSRPPPEPPSTANSSTWAPSAVTPAGRAARGDGLPCGQQTRRNGAAAPVRDARCAHRREQRLLPRPSGKCRAAASASSAKRHCPATADRRSGFLNRARVSDESRVPYEEAYDLFVKAEGKAVDFVNFPRSGDPLAFDAALERFIETQYDNGAHKADLNYLIAAVGHLSC